MMVMRGTVDTTITQAGFASGDTRIFPADRCVWSQVDDADGGYSIENASFVGLTHTPGANPTSGRYILLTDATLGYIGKSGRFVAISN